MKLDTRRFSPGSGWAPFPGISGRAIVATHLQFCTEKWTENAWSSRLRIAWLGVRATSKLETRLRPRMVAWDAEWEGDADDNVLEEEEVDDVRRPVNDEDDLDIPDPDEETTEMGDGTIL